MERVHGRTDEEKIRSLASADRNRKVVGDALSFVAPGGAAGAAVAKVGYAKKGLQAAKTGLKVASKLGKGAVKKGAKKAVGAVANRARKAGVKGVAKYASKQGTKLAKYKGKILAQSKANENLSKAARKNA